MLFAGKWMKLEDFMLSKVSQTQKVKGHMFSLICGSYRYAHIYSEREVSESEGTTGGGRGKENDKY
jgi:hypothetical protein